MRYQAQSSKVKALFSLIGSIQQSLLHCSINGILNEFQILSNLHQPRKGFIYILLIQLERVLRVTSPGWQYSDVWRWNVPPASLTGSSNTKNKTSCSCVFRAFGDFVCFFTYLRLKILRMGAVFSQQKWNCACIWCLHTFKWWFAWEHCPQFYEPVNMIMERNLPKVPRCKSRIWSWILHHHVLNQQVLLCLPLPGCVLFMQDESSPESCCVASYLCE